MVGVGYACNPLALVENHRKPVGDYTCYPTANHFTLVKMYSFLILLWLSNNIATDAFASNITTHEKVGVIIFASSL